MAEPEAPQLTTEDYTHEEAIARIEELEDAICEALELFEKDDPAGAAQLLEVVLAEEDDEDEGDEDDDDGEEEEDED